MYSTVRKGCFRTAPDERVALQQVSNPWAHFLLRTEHVFRQRESHEFISVIGCYVVFLVKVCKTFTFCSVNKSSSKNRVIFARIGGA